MKAKTPRGGRTPFPKPYTLEAEPDKPEIVFAKTLKGGGYYITALRKLDLEGGVLRFSSSKCMNSVRKAARKMDLDLEFAMDGDNLLVKIARS